MKVFYNGRHPLHHGRHEMFRGQLVPCFEVPARVDHVLGELRSRGLGRVADAPEVELAVLERIHAQALVVSLGVDTFAGDPIAGFTLGSADYLRMGEDLAAAGLPTLFVFEGGYAVAEVGVNAVNVLEGFAQRAP